MIPEKIIYTDGHDVIVTDSSFKVKNQTYLLRGIVAHWLNVLNPPIVPWIVTAVIGVVGMVVAVFAIFPYEWNIQTNGEIIQINKLIFWMGLGLTVISGIILLLLRTRYALRISTAEGEKDTITSTKKEYIGQISSALNKAFSIRKNYGIAESELPVESELYNQDTV